MKILLNRDFCKITFAETEKYPNKTVLISGECGLNKDFYVYKSQLHEMDWFSPTEKKPGRCVNVEESLRDEILSYVMQEAEKAGYTFVLK